MRAQNQEPLYHELVSINLNALNAPSNPLNRLSSYLSEQLKHCWLCQMLLASESTIIKYKCLFCECSLWPYTLPLSRKHTMKPSHLQDQHQQWDRKQLHSDQKKHTCVCQSGGSIEAAIIGNKSFDPGIVAGYLLRRLQMTKGYKIPFNTFW